MTSREIDTSVSHSARIWDYWRTELLDEPTEIDLFCAVGRKPWR